MGFYSAHRNWDLIIICIDFCFLWRLVGHITLHHHSRWKAKKENIALFYVLLIGIWSHCLSSEVLNDFMGICVDSAGRPIPLRKFKQNTEHSMDILIA